MSFKKFLRRRFHKHLGTASFKEQHLLLDFSTFYYKQTDNCFSMKELGYIFPLKFLNVELIDF